MGHSWVIEIGKRLWSQDGQERKLVWPRMPRIITHTPFALSIVTEEQEGNLRALCKVDSLAYIVKNS